MLKRIKIAVTTHIVDGLGTTLLIIPGIGYAAAAAILAEIGDFSNFASPDKTLAFARMSPSTYQSGQLTNCYAHMEKRGSKYLRYALYNAAKFDCNWENTCSAYLVKKRSEDKRYNVALSHAAKNLVRLIFVLEKIRLPYMPAAQQSLSLCSFKASVRCLFCHALIFVLIYFAFYMLPS